MSTRVPPDFSSGVFSIENVVPVATEVASADIVTSPSSPLAVLGVIAVIVVPAGIPVPEMY